MLLVRSSGPKALTTLQRPIVCGETCGAELGRVIAISLRKNADTSCEMRLTLVHERNLLQETSHNAWSEVSRALISSGPRAQSIISRRSPQYWTSTGRGRE